MQDKKSGKFLFGICKVEEKGQIVIPKEARDVYNIKSGDSLIVMGDKNKGMFVVKAEVFSAVSDEILGDN